MAAPHIRATPRGNIATTVRDTNPRTLRLRSTGFYRLPTRLLLERYNTAARERDYNFIRPQEEQERRRRKNRLHL